MEMTPQLKAMFALADLNGDDAVDESELTNYLDRMGMALSAAKAGQLRAVVFSEQAGLWPLVDLNRDGRLSRRELQGVPSIIQRLTNGDGTLNAGNLPLTTLVVLQRGPFAAADAKDVLRDGGPVWFNRADRNADGDLDRDEFPGTPDDFQKVDLNRDGWINLQEAAQFNVAAARGSDIPRADAPQESKP